LPKQILISVSALTWNFCNLISKLPNNDDFSLGLISEIKLKMFKYVRLVPSVCLQGFASRAL
jgi:hypothetical protein